MSDTTISYPGMTGTTFGPVFLQENGLQFKVYVNSRKSGVQWVITFRRKGQTLPEAETVISRLDFDGTTGKTYSLSLTSANFPLAPWSWTDPNASPALNTYGWDLIVFQASDNSVHGTNTFTIANQSNPPAESVWATLTPAGATPNGAFAPATLSANGLTFSVSVPNSSAYLNVSRVVTFRLPGGLIQPETVISQFEFIQTKTTATYTLTAANFPNAPWSWTDPNATPALGVYAWEFVLFHPRDYEIHGKTPFQLAGDPNAPAGPLTIYGSPTATFSRAYLAAYGLCAQVQFGTSHSTGSQHFLTFRRPGHDIESENTISRLNCNPAGTQTFFFSPDNFPKAPWDWNDPTKSPALSSFEWELVLYSQSKKVELSTPLHISQTDIDSPPNCPTNFTASLAPGSLESAAWSLPAQTSGIQNFLVRLAWVDGNGNRQHQDWSTSGPTIATIGPQTIATAFLAGQAFTISVATKYPGAPDRCLGPVAELSGTMPGVELLQAGYGNGQFSFQLRPSPNQTGAYTCAYQALIQWSLPSSGSLPLNLGDETTPLTDGLISGSVPAAIPDGPARLTVYSQKIEGNLTTRSPDSPAGGVICVTEAPTVRTLTFDPETNLIQFTFQQPMRLTQGISQFFAILQVFTPDPTAPNGLTQNEQYFALSETSDPNATGFRVQSGSGDDAILAGTIDGSALDPAEGFALELCGAGGPPAQRNGVTTGLFFGPPDVSLFNSQVSAVNVRRSQGVYGGQPPTLLSVAYGQTGQGEPCLFVDYDPHRSNELYTFFLHSSDSVRADQYGPEFGWVPYATVSLPFARPVQATDQYTLDSVMKTTTQDAEGNTVPMKSPTGPNPPAKVILARPLGLSADFDATAGQIQLQWTQDSMFGVDAFQARLTPASGDPLYSTPDRNFTNTSGNYALTITVASVPGFDPGEVYSVSLVGLGNAYPEWSDIQFQVIGPWSDSVPLGDHELQVSNPVFTEVSVDTSPAGAENLRLTATWEAVDGATAYVLQVYNHESGPGHSGNYQRLPPGTTTGSVDFQSGSADRALIIALFGSGTDTSSDPVAMLVDAPTTARLDFIRVGQNGFGFRGTWTPLSDPALPYRVELGTDAPAPFWNDPNPLTAPGASGIEPDFAAVDGRPVPNCTYTMRVRATDEIPGAIQGEVIRRAGPWSSLATAPPYLSGSDQYDARGRLLTATRGGASAVMTYDERANLIHVTTTVSGNE